MHHSSVKYCVDQFKETILFPTSYLLSQWKSSHTYSMWRRHVRCRSHDLSSLPHHLLVSTYVSPVGAITVVHRPEDAAWLHKTKRHPSSRVRRGVTVASMSQGWRDWGLVLLPAATKKTGETTEYQGWLIIYSNIQVDPTDAKTTCHVSGRVTPQSSTST